MSDQVTTSVAYPWALAIHGGALLGKRFRTKLMFLTRTEAKDGIVQVYYGRTVLKHGHGSTPTVLAKQDRKVPVKSVFEDWRHLPAPHQVKAAKKKVPVCSAVYEYAERMK